MSTTPKLLIENAKITSNSAGAEALVTYYCDYGGSSTPGINLLNLALEAVPQVGAQWPNGTINGGPLSNTSGLIPSNGLTGPRQHQLRVSQITSRATNNAQKIFVDVLYRSRPAPSLEYDSSLTQKVVQTYLASFGSANVGNSPIAQRGQMTVPWTLAANAPTNPTGQAFTYPTVPASDSVLRFGASLRLSATFYQDEMASAAMQSIQSDYSGRTNGNNGIFLFPSDYQCWICSNISISSPDAGYTNRISAEWTYNIDGWDSVVVYTDPVTQAPAALDASTLAQLYNPLTVGDGYNNVFKATVLNGAARYPQHQFADFTPLLTMLLRGTPLS